MKEIERTNLEKIGNEARILKDHDGSCVVVFRPLPATPMVQEEDEDEWYCPGICDGAEFENEQQARLFLQLEKEQPIAKNGYPIFDIDDIIDMARTGKHFNQ